MKKLTLTKVGDHHYQIDMRGWPCPYPKYAVELLSQKLHEGDNLDMLVDCPSAATDVPKAAKVVGCETQSVTKINNGEWKITLHKLTVAPIQIDC